MLMMVLYVCISGVLGYLFYRWRLKNLKATSNCSKKPLIIGVFNLILILVFGLWFVKNPQDFSNEKEIVWNLWMVLFTIFTVYFYLLAVPLSFFMCLIDRKRYSVHKEKFLYHSYLINGLASTGLIVLIYFILV